MADEQWLKTNVVFGSAGMAASGMLPRAEVKKKKVPLPKPGEEQQSGAGASADAESNSEKIEEYAQPESYGIHAKAQREYAGLKAGIIGNGDRLLSGVNWDAALSGIKGVSVEGISEPDEQLLAEFQQTLQIENGYADYREMMARTKPNLAVIPQAGTAARHDIIKTCLMSGAHVLCPAPFTRTLEDADELLALADRRGLKIAAAMPFRVDPNVMRFYQMRQGLIGDLVEIRVFGGMDEDSGGKDMLLHGAPLFDLVRMFAGDPMWCSANVITEGARSTREDIFEDPEGLFGSLAGDTIQAEFFTENHVMVHFVSDRKLKMVTGGWGMEFVGSHGIMRFLAGSQPEFSLLENPGHRSAITEEHWGIWPENLEFYHYEEDGIPQADAANRLVIYDWLDAITEDREACCSGRRATRALEMVHAVWQSGLSGKRVFFPMANRHHALVADIRPFQTEAA